MGVNVIVKAIKDNQVEIKQLIAEKQDWSTAQKRFALLYLSMSNPGDKLWSQASFGKFKEVYYAQREKDKGMSNIITRTLVAIPEKLKNDTRIMFLQMAEVCSLFNASHKVNFEADELPKDFSAIKVIPGKAKGVFTYAVPTASIYKKTSLTFDYWVPKFIEWTEEIRSKKLKDWKGEAILQHESCTDFMRICVMFLSNPNANPPIAKAEDREAFLKHCGEEFVWIKKSAKREDILTNNKKLIAACSKISKESGIDIPLEAWSRIQQVNCIKSLLR